MTDLPLLETRQPDCVSNHDHSVDQPGQHGPGWLNVTVHWTDLDLLVDNCFEALTDCFNCAKNDRESALFYASEALRMHRLARIAEAEQNAAREKS